MSEQPKPLIQIDDEVREMTHEEYAQYLIDQENAPQMTTTNE